LHGPASSASLPPAADTRYERVDHFWWLVRDVRAVEALFRDTLGFTLGDDWFAVGTFLELVSPLSDRPSLGEAVEAFLRVHEGAWKMGVHVNDLDEVARDLTARGLDVSDPDGGDAAGVVSPFDLAYCEAGHVGARHRPPHPRRAEFSGSGRIVGRQ
jgi:catechol 2,3-dioxygenase-like lactoylglutathione lyase family enzyme